ncbi:G-alpha-domain-containing protein [Gymnopus androsaceus JB14]|uniref:G-alpha-domain-containing protein n=1 Tax=Gymnopus androsaceus JB14 TaxID=1447944 RepID=A0A6A4GPD8_9AGAR|nr:G-alpha-domain-containing protein [Gymnopus androsaceus JB14]
MSEDSETSSILTITSSSTVPGLGSLSGKAIKRVGTAVLNRVEDILIRRRLAQAEALLGQRADTANANSVLKSLYSDLLELSRLSVRTRAFRLIMRQVGAMDFEELAAAVTDWSLFETYDLLKAMILCIRHEGGSMLQQLKAYHAAGLAAYKTRLPYASSEFMPRSILCTSFMLYMSMLISLSSSPTLSRLIVVELDLLTFIMELYPGILEQNIFKYSWSEQHLLAIQLVLLALSVKLDSVADALLVTQVHRLLTPITKILDADHWSIGDTKNDSPIASGNEVLRRIRSHISTNKQSQIYQSDVAPGTRIGEPIRECYTRYCIRTLTSGNEAIGNHGIEKQLRRDRTMRRNESQSKLLQQINSLGEEYDDEKRKSYKGIIFSNIIQFTIGILRDMLDLGLTLAPENDAYGEAVLSLPSKIDVSKEAIHRSREPNESGLYYLKSIDRITDPDYMPTDEDIIQTTGITETTLKIGELIYKMVNVGDQRSERRKWIHSFEDVTAVVFFAKLSDYDQMFTEDKNKLRHSPLINELVPGNYFPKYKGGDNYDEAYRYLCLQFLSLHHAREDIYLYETTSTTDTLELLQKSIQDILIKNRWSKTISLLV